jgi:hypothetical protein
MSHEKRLDKLEAAIGPAEPITIRVLEVPAHRWAGEPPLTAEEILAYTSQVITVAGRAA